MTYHRPVTIPVMTIPHLLILARIPEKDLQHVLRNVHPHHAQQVMKSQANLREWARRVDFIELPEVTEQPPMEEPSNVTEWITVECAAQILGLTERAVRSMADRGVIRGQQAREGSPWQIDRGSVESELCRRQERENRAA